MARGPYFTYRPGGLSDRLFGGDPLVTLQRELNRVFEELDLPQRAGASTGAGVAGSLSVDVTETADGLTVRADLPGVAESDVDVTLNDDVLTIRGERKAERRAERETVHVLERTTGAFQRSIRLPIPVDPEQVSAEFSGGVLTVTLPKPRAGDRSRKIQVRAAGRSSGAPVDASTEGGATGGTPMSGSVTGGAGGSAEGAGGYGFIQGDGAGGASPSTGVGDAPSDVEPPTDVENAAKPGGAVHGYNE